MKIIVEPKVFIQLMSYAAATHLEFSGFGFCQRKDGDIHVYDFVLMDVGSEGYTEFGGKKMLPLLEREDRANMKVWIHRHPINNWSSRDLQTILKEPLGSTPELAQWSVSMVLTPSGWIGRIDNYKKGITQDLEVEPNVKTYYEEVCGLLGARNFRPFPNVLDGRWADEPDYEEPEGIDDYDEWGPNDEGDAEVDYETTCEVLLSLLEEYRSPATTTLSEVLDDYGIAWEKPKKEVR